MSERRRLPDQQARDRIEAALDINLLVEAGAGSGKTQSLARRMAAGIAAGVYEVEGMAAVTFTRKAAAELRARFQLELEKRLGADDDPARRERLQVALRHLERLFAGTIHAFCAHLLRERPVEAGVAPGFTELDEIEDAEVRGRAWRDYLDRERALGSRLLAELQDTGIRPADLDEAFRTVCTFADVTFPPGDREAPDPAPAWAALDQFWQALSALLPDPCAPDTTCKVQRAARRYRGLLRVADRERPATLAQLLDCWSGKLSITQKWWPGGSTATKALKARIDRLLGDFQEAAVHPFLAAWGAYIYRLAITLLSAARNFASEARRRALTLNYGDLLQVAARLLRDNLPVRAALQRKYRWLFVDEFQDTNPLQAEVILLLAAEARGEADWTRVRPRPGALFVVGDPKQSIYRFTGADIDIYSRVRDIIQREGGEVVTLTASFRSIPALCEWANGVFPDFFPPEPTPQQPAFHPLEPVLPGGQASRSGLRTLTIPDSIEKDGVHAADAQAIARYIRAAVESGTNVWSDFLILTRKKKGRLHEYLAALDALHIPASVTGSVAFSRSREVSVLADLLRVLADPDDGVALVGLLRGPLFGVSDEELFQHHEAGLGFILTAPLPDEASGPVVDAIRKLQPMFKLTRTLPVAAAVERILEETGILARAVAVTPGAAEAGDVLYALDRVRQITEVGGTLATAAEALDKDFEAAEIESIPLEPGRQDVVRVMNLHKAKGLEASVVFLADPLAGVKARAGVRVIREGARATGYLRLIRTWGEGRSDELAEPAGWEEHAAAELAYVEAEEKRLLYVAATRAKDLLVVSRWAKDGKGERPWEPLAAYLAAARELKVPPAIVVTPRALPDLSVGARAAAESARNAAREAAAQASWVVESVTGTAHRAGPYGHPISEGRTREPDTGMAWGSLIHALLEHAMRGPARDRAHLERLANWLTVENPELRRVVPEALDTVERVTASEFWQRATAADQRLVEVPFAVKVEAGDGPPKILHGVIDLAFRTSAGWELVDYKTDQATIHSLSARYHGQVQAYCRHWAVATDAPIRSAAIYAVRTGEVSENLQP
ncbi:MAG: UvrD-helicase domain-containing protein [Candidatus Rokubacteria bacterium]|nr:UvrD-helicase domain-containing protein [Candidatus Rokubacteria bacterium]